MITVFSAGGPAEGSQGSASNAEADAIVRRRLLISAGAGAGLLALSLIPSELLDGSASKPLYEYLVPLLRSIVRDPRFLIFKFHDVLCTPGYLYWNS